MIKKFAKGIFKKLYQETVGTDLTNRNVTLSENIKKKDLPNPEISELKFQLYDSPGKFAATTINTRFYADTKAIFILFDLTDEESFKGVQNYISISKTFYEICKKNKIEHENDQIRQPELFKDLPIFILGNKSDLIEQRKILNAQIEEFIQDLKNTFSFTKLTYHEISVKENKGIEKIFQESIFYYLKRNFEPIIYKKKHHNENEEDGLPSNENSDNELNKNNNLIMSNSFDSNKNLNNINNDNNQNDLFLDIKEEKKNKKKRPSMDKSVVIFHQMIDKMKKQFHYELNSIKEENKKEIEKLKINFYKENTIVNQKLIILENKNKEFEEIIKRKDKEMEELKQKLDNINLSNKEINLKFKIPDQKFKNEININTKGEKKMSEVINILYELCPYITNLKVKCFCLEGNENNKIDEMKTVKENNLVNDSLIMLIL